MPWHSLEIHCPLFSVRQGTGAALAIQSMPGEPWLHKSIASPSAESAAELVGWCKTGAIAGAAGTAPTSVRSMITAVGILWPCRTTTKWTLSPGMHFSIRDMKTCRLTRAVPFQDSRMSPARTPAESSAPSGVVSCTVQTLSRPPCPSSSHVISAPMEGRTLVPSVVWMMLLAPRRDKSGSSSLPLRRRKRRRRDSMMRPSGCCSL
mmetsp:Transcript_71325/g.125539  ORF Transcript_71325/g.125539 Transcript_71325/m.125539 type:complete len:206 (+) Transcript_71325:28-645(+)